MGNKKNSKFFPNLIGNSPKKVIAIVVVITIIMGFFASNVDMDTEEQAFQPDIPKQEYMLEINEKFGESEEIVQIAFTAEDEDVFTVEVLKDIQEMEERLLEDEDVNSTLVRTNQVPSGIMTLRSAILRAGQSLEVNDFVIDRVEKTDDGLKAAENQTQMYMYMNSSLSLNLYLSQTFIENESVEAGLGSMGALFSMSDIVSEPYSWEAVAEHQDEFKELLVNLNPESDMSHEELSSFMNEWLDDMQEENDPYIEYFLNLTKSTKSILDAEPPEGVNYDQEKDIARLMTLSFFAKAEPLGHLAEFDFGDMEEDPPSLESSFEEEKEILANMTDDDVKKTVSDVMNYDSTELNSSVDKGVANFEYMTEEAEKSSEKLTNMEILLNMTIEEIEEIEDDEGVGVEDAAEHLREGYLKAVQENQTIVDSSKEMYLESKETIELSRQLAPLLERMSEMVKNMVSNDFSPDGDPESISAKIGLGMAFMDPSIEGGVRLTAQESIIEVGEDISEDSSMMVRVSATQVMLEQINESANRSIRTLLPIAFIMVVIILSIVFRSFLETFLSLSVLVIAIIWTFGFGVLLGYQFNPMIVAVPILLTGLVIDYGIQVTMRYREERDKGYNPKMSHILAISTVGVALVLTSFTTSVGFLSKTLSNVEAMQQFGMLAAVGIISSFFLMVAFLPSVIRIFDKRKEEKEKGRGSKRLVDKTERYGKNIIGGMLSTSAQAADKHPVLVILVVSIITFSSIYGVLNIDSTFDIEDFLPDDQPQSKNMGYIRANFEVTTNHAYVIIEDGDFSSSEYLYALDEASNDISDSEIVGGYGDDVVTPLTVLRNYGTAPPGSLDHNSSIVQKFAESDTTGDGIPDENVAELYEMLYDFERSRESIENVLYRESEGEYVSSLIRSSVDQEKILDDLDNALVLENDLEEAVEPLEREGFSTKITANPMINQEMTSELMTTQSRSLIFTVLIVALTLSLIFYHFHKSIILGVITTIPVAMITMWIIGTMYLLGVPFNVMTVSITALTVGMGIDYSILVTHRFMEERSGGDDLSAAMSETVQKKGAALLGSAGTTIAAFVILAASDILLLSQFGYVTALALLYSFIVAVFVLPSGLMVWAKYKRKREIKPCPDCGTDLTWVDEYERWYCLVCEGYKEEEKLEEKVCPDCGDDLIWVDAYEKWYCYRCEEYKEEDTKACPDCDEDLVWVDEYERWYCLGCEEYKEEDTKACPDCDEDLVWVDEYERWYCLGCEEYKEEDIKACPDCDEDLVWVDEYERWYCLGCEEYKESEGKGKVPTSECPNCGAEIGEEDGSCKNCGVVFEESVVYECPDCGAEIGEEDSSCKNCGAVFEEEEAETRSCPDCDTDLTWVDEYERWYCYNCKMYK